MLISNEKVRCVYCRDRGSLIVFMMPRSQEVVPEDDILFGQLGIECPEIIVECP